MLHLAAPTAPASRLLESHSDKDETEPYAIVLRCIDLVDFSARQCFFPFFEPVRGDSLLEVLRPRSGITNTIQEVVVHVKRKRNWTGARKSHIREGKIHHVAEVPVGAFRNADGGMLTGPAPDSFRM